MSRREVRGGSWQYSVLGPQSGRHEKTCAVHVPFMCKVSELAPPELDLIVADLAQLVTPGLRSPRAHLVALPHLGAVQHKLAGGAGSLADAIENVVNCGLEAMETHTHENPTSRLADPVAALRAVLALRPGAERVKSKTRRFAAAQALGLLSGDGWRAHYERALLLDLAKAIHAIEADSLTLEENSPRIAETNLDSGGAGIAKFYPDFVDIAGDWESLFATSSTLDLAIMYGATWRNTAGNTCTLSLGALTAGFASYCPTPLSAPFSSSSTPKPWE